MKGQLAAVFNPSFGPTQIAQLPLNDTDLDWLRDQPERGITQSSTQFDPSERLPTAVSHVAAAILYTLKEPTPTVKFLSI